MKAVYIEEQGGIEKLIYGERPEPKVGPGEVLVKIRATALNHLDIYARAGLNGVSVGGFPRILGSDIAGEVVELGKGITQARNGDRVIVENSIKCGVCKYCSMSRDELCTNPKGLGVTVDGGYAEYVKVPASIVHDIPHWMPFDEGAAIGLVYHTAWHCLITRAQLKPGEDILITAAGSGVGSAAIQLAKRIGARVITTAGTDEKLEKARELGADEVINYVKEERYSDKVKALTEGEGVDMVLD
ncbi:MAG: alcohol dehydrogenase catalytic domain-containing protein, partial [Dehalococcoidia bacterium]